MFDNFNKLMAVQRTDFVMNDTCISFDRTLKNLES